MARSSKAVAVSGTSKSIAVLDQELAQEVANLKGQISQASSNRITANAAGTFTLPDGLDLGDEFQCVVIDFISKNQYYDTPYQKDVATAPGCYAMGKVLSEMAPEDDSPHPQHDRCATCPMNQFGSAANGKGKACSNRRIVALVVADPNDPDSINDPHAPIYTMDLPPTAIKSFDGAVSYIARALNKPPLGALLTVRGENVGTYSRITFGDPVPNPAYAMHASRRQECQDMLFKRPDFEAAAAAPSRSRAAPRRNMARARTATR